MEGTKRTKNHLLFSVLSANLASITIGYSFAWSSSSIPRLNGSAHPTENPLSQPVSPSEESILASLVAIGALLSPFAATILSDKIGRKKTLIISIIPLYIGYLLIASANELWYLILGRFLSGISVGSVYAVIPNYIAEIADKENRGAMSSILAVGTCFGNLLMYSIGPFLTIRDSALVALAAPTLFLIAFSIIAPESPYYLVSKDMVNNAEQVLIKLRASDGPQVEQELQEIRKTIEESYANKQNILDIFKEWNLTKRLIITVGLVLFQQLSGVSSILFYLQTVFIVAKTNISPELSTIIIAVVQFITALITPIPMDKLGRKFLLLVSALGCLITLMAMGVFFHIKNTGGPYLLIGWLPVTSLVIYIISFSLGFGPVPPIILGEIFPPHVKAAASTITITMFFFFMFSTSASFPYLLDLLGEALSFWFFAVCCAISIVFIVFAVPETKEKSLIEVQRMFERKSEII